MSQKELFKNDPTADKEFTEDEFMELCQVNSKGPQKKRYPTSSKTRISHNLPHKQQQLQDR